MQRDVRPMTISYKEASIVFDMTGWYCDPSEESIHTGEDMQVSDQALQTLKETRNG
jgi:HTH-type transcriptional regulator/antitoxin MqsA